MNKQDALNKNWQYFVVERHVPSYDPPQRPGQRPICLYQGPQSRCSIGNLLPDDAHAKILDKGLEWLAVESIIEDVPEAAAVLKDASLTFLNDLQAVHDDWALEWANTSPNDWTGIHWRLTALAAKWGLTIPA